MHVLAVHPGYSSTNLQANRFPLWELVNDLLAMSSVEGALSQIFGKTLISDKYCDYYRGSISNSISFSRKFVFIFDLGIQYGCFSITLLILFAKKESFVITDKRLMCTLYVCVCFYIFCFCNTYL